MLKAPAAALAICAAFLAPPHDTRHAAEEIRNNLKLPALQVAVSLDGRLVAEESLGLADVAREVPIGHQSAFRVGSVSKLLTATAAVRLHQAGTLDLDAPCERYLPDIPADKARITLRQLAGHLGGVGHYGANDYINTTQYQDVAESLGRTIATPLLDAPGNRYAYSSYGFNLLGAVLQNAAGEDFRAVVHKHVLGPLGMAHTTAEDSARSPAERVRLYSRDAKGDLVESPHSNLTDRWPSGGYLSTAGDLVRFAGGLLDARFLKRAAQDMLFTSQRTADGKETGVGLGWRIGRDARGRRFVHHGGDAVGGRAFVLLYPDHAVAVALVTNLTLARLGEKESLTIAEPYLRH